jgi:hypothetical protein
MGVECQTWSSASAEARDVTFIHSSLYEYMRAWERGVDVERHAFLTSVLRRRMVTSRPDRFTSVEKSLRYQLNRRWEISTSWTPQNVVTSCANIVLHFLIIFQFSFSLPSSVPDAKIWSASFMVRLNISELKITKHKIVTHHYLETATLFPRW